MPRNCSCNGWVRWMSLSWPSVNATDSWSCPHHVPSLSWCIPSWSLDCAVWSSRDRRWWSHRVHQQVELLSCSLTRHRISEVHQLPHSPSHHVVFEAKYFGSLGSLSWLNGGTTRSSAPSEQVLSANCTSYLYLLRDSWCPSYTGNLAYENSLLMSDGLTW